MPGFVVPFSAPDALLAMRLSSLAYMDFEHDEQPLRFALAGLGLELLGKLSERSPGSSIFKSIRNDTQAFCAGDARRVHMVFRGSEPNLWDWLTDFRIDKAHVTVADGIEIHEGFYSALSGPRTRQALQDWIALAAGRPITLAGHSLGGALAAAVAVLYPFIHQGLGFAGCYTFGQPRIGLIAVSVSTPIWRVVNKADIVPRVPLDFAAVLSDALGPVAGAVANFPGLGAFNAAEYSHAGVAEVVGRDGKLDPLGEQAHDKFIEMAIACSAAELITVILSGGKFKYQGDLIADHFRDSYLDALQGLQN